MTEVTLAVYRGEDDSSRWVIGTRSRREARACVARECHTHSWTLQAVTSAVRPISRDRCAAADHPAEHCVCWRRGEDWYQRCPATESGAIVAWRIKPRATVRRWRALRDLRTRAGQRRITRRAHNARATTTTSGSVS